MVINMVKSVNKYMDEIHGGLYNTPADAIAAENENKAIINGQKKIVTDRCRNCPMREERYSPNSKTYYICTCPDTDGWEIEHLDLIPNWCVLDDD